METEQVAGRRGRARRVLPLGAALLLVTGAAAGLLAPATPASADPVEKCTATTGAVVAVDFGPFGGKVERGCDTTPTTGYDLLHEAGFSTTGTVKDGPAFICRIGHGSFGSGTQYPTPAAEKCEITPPASAYWSYWIASPGQKKWTYSPYGAMARKPQPGDVDAWVFGATSIGGTTGGPKFTPDDVRAGGGAPVPDDPTVPQVPAAEVDLAKATRWLAGRLKDGERVVDEADERRNQQATTEVALALAATDPAAAAKVAAHLARPEQTDAYAYPLGKDQAPDTLAAARLALVADATGGDPRATGGHDLLGDLVKNVCTAGADAPEPVPGCTTKGDFRTDSGQADGQALAVLALLGGGVEPPADAVRRLTDLQCEDGGFTSMLIPAGGYCESEAGATGMAALALWGAGGHDEAVASARAYLRKSQLPTGAWPAVYYSTVGSAYATGFAAQAMRALGDTARADAGVSWLSGQQLPGGAFAFEEGSTDPLLFATGPAVLAGARSDLVALTTEKPAPPPTLPPGPAPDLAKGTAYLTDRARLIRGRYYESAPGTGHADFGLTIDGAYALAATGTDNATLRGIVDFLATGGKDGSGRDVHAWAGLGTPYVTGGRLGKAALLAEAVGRDPRKFAGKDLLAELAGATCAGPSPEGDGACAGKGAYRNAGSVFSQALGVMAQLRAGESAAAAEPVAYLKSLQEPSGAWPSLVGAPSRAEVDSTAMAAMALDLLPDERTQASVDKALAWLAAQQKADGGFPGASGNSVNSAALAVQGLFLDAATYQKEIAAARAFLATQQNADGGFAVAQDAPQRDSDVRASTQALGGSTGISFGTLTRDLSGTVPAPDPGDPGTGPGGAGGSGSTGGNGGSGTGGSGTGGSGGAGGSGGTTTPPVIVTPGETGGTGTAGGTGAAGGTGGTAGSGAAGGTGIVTQTGGTASQTGGVTGTGGGLASTGARVTTLAAAAALLVLGGFGATRLARRQRTAKEGPR
ncbi:prenyltransferase/squalene oxidase repeat-containing protein [Streptomyces sp. NPDC015131]|uniref:prenyltransferase/squalene oxidase repeat-containing protein n=1 Tax=Streptomyces sp. NPDC015131 TaxID=3364941 RepID=UPI0036FA3B28